MSMSVLIWTSIIIYSAVAGSFLTMLAHRLPMKMLMPECGLNYFKPVSYCAQCHRTLQWRHQFPIIGFLTSKGICAHCHEKIPRWYMAVEISFIVMMIILFGLYGLTSAFFMMSLFVFFAMALALIDLHFFLLPDVLVFPLLALGLIANAFHLFVPLKQALIGGAVGFAFFFSAGWLYKRLAHRDGMGLGDVKLMAALGAWSGVSGVLFTALIGSMTLLGYAVIVQWMKPSKKSWRKRPLPFGPFLLLGGLASLLLNRYVPFIFLGALA